MSGTVGVTPNVDIGVVVPLVTVKLSGTSTTVNGNGVVSRLVETNNVFSGLGDMAAFAKFRIAEVQRARRSRSGWHRAQRHHAAADRQPRQSSRPRCDTHAGFVRGSFGKGPLKPHGSVSFEYWNKALDVPGPTT